MYVLLFVALPPSATIFLPSDFEILFLFVLCSAAGHSSMFLAKALLNYYTNRVRFLYINIIFYNLVIQLIQQSGQYLAYIPYCVPQMQVEKLYHQSIKLFVITLIDSSPYLMSLLDVASRH